MNVDDSAGARPGNRRGSRARVGDSKEAVGIPGGDGPTASPSWGPIDPAALGAEQDYRVRSGDREATARLNGHGQWISSDTRRLLDWQPAEVLG